ncbi:MAG TPA: hypothetical protein VFW83_01250 [Bryobacteraceae bacterium]|nr:hypothetical protein [Bryobacteraceae bacterium]
MHDWGFSMTVDPVRNLVYTMFASPAYDYWGGDRKGNNLFGNSVVALDANTGKMKWFFQLVHHDLWDFDLPPAPVLLDVTVDGRKQPVIAQTGKVAFMILGRGTTRFRATVRDASGKVNEELSWPCQKPPWGRLTAVNAVTGEFA